MSGSHRMLRETAERVPARKCNLAPPLSERHAFQYSVKVSDLPLVDQGLIYLSDPVEGCVTALDERKLDSVWRYRQGMPGSVKAIDSGLLVAWVERDSLDVVDANSGALVATVSCPGGSEAVLRGDTLLGQTWREGSVLFAARVTTRRVAWEWRPPSQVRISNVFCSDAKAVYFGLTDGTVAALAVGDGADMWRNSVAGLLTGAQTGDETIQGCGVLWGDRAIFELRGNGVVAFDRGSGRHSWSQLLPAAVCQGYFYDERYWALTSIGRLFSLDPETGRVISDTNLKAALPRKLAGVSIRKPLLVSESHVFTGSHQGYILGFDRTDGAYAWSYRPKGGGSTDHDGSTFASANGRLYYSDTSRRVYCMEERESADRGG